MKTLIVASFFIAGVWASVSNAAVITATERCELSGNTLTNKSAAAIKAKLNSRITKICGRGQMLGDVVLANGEAVDGTVPGLPQTAQMRCPVKAYYICVPLSEEGCQREKFERASLETVMMTSQDSQEVRLATLDLQKLEVDAVCGPKTLSVESEKLGPGFDETAKILEQNLQPVGGGGNLSTNPTLQ